MFYQVLELGYKVIVHSRLVVAACAIGRAAIVLTIATAGETIWERHRRIGRVLPSFGRDLCVICGTRRLA